MEYLALMRYLGKAIQNILKRSGALVLPAALLALVCGGGAALLLPHVPVAQAAPEVAEAPATSSHNNPASSGNGSAGHVTVIILDMSGSMSENDPDGLRCSAANAYIDLSGPGDFVGVVGLDGTGSGGPDNFGVAVDWGLAPRDMSTIAARQALINAVSQKSNQCRPDDDTPTYDALSQALAMLASSTQGGAYSGSVILLTDGTPYPSTNAQISAIQTQLVPQFKAHDWPIDAIALGSDQSFFPFLSGITSATSGTFYYDGRGVVPGVSPLNIAPFFVDIFRLRNGRSPGPTIGPTELNGGVTARNFSVGQYVTELDVIVLKDNPATTVSILAPDGQRIPPPTAGAFVATDPHFVIISLDTPQPGSWEIDVSGTGLFLMDSLKVSALTLALTSPSSSGPLALGEPFTVSAQLSDQGIPISGGHFNLIGTVSFVGDSATPFTEDILLADQGGSDTYSVLVTIPTSAPTGSYQIEVQAQSATEDVLTAQSVIRLDLFPSALLIGQHGATINPVTAAVTQWDKPLQLLYSLPIASFFSGWPLAGIPAQPSAVVRGQVELNGKPYTNATVAGTATRAGTTRQIPVTFVNDGGGAFHLIFPSDADGTYTLALTTQGAYDISHGDLTHVSRSVEVNLVPNTAAERLRAYLVTLFYLLILAFLALLFRYILAPKPRGAIISTPGGADEFGRARRPQALFSPSTVESGQMGLDPGLSFRFARGGRVWVRGTTAHDNYRQAGGKVPTTWFSAANAELSSSDGRVRYSIEAGGRRNISGRLDTRSELAKRIVGSRPSGGRDDDDDRRRSGRAGLFSARRGSQKSYDDDDRGSQHAASKSRSESGRSRYLDDQDERPRQRRSRGDDDW
ncbi:MAG: vWA domain-containing protein [Ktedonobacterales bacterium]